MKMNRAKKAIALVLCFLMLSAFPLSAMGATFISNKEMYPVILLNNMADNDLYVNPNTGYQEQAFPPNLNTDLKFAQYLSTYIAGVAQGEYLETTHAIFPEVMGWFENIRCNLDGTSRTNGIGPVAMNGYPMSAYINNTDMVDLVAGEIGKMLAEEYGADKVYVFSYDWRLDPIAYAQELNQLIQQVKKDTGYSKVNIVSNGMGANIVSVYFNKYGLANNFADINAYIPINSTAMGATIIGDLFSGKIDVDPNGIVRYTNDLSDNLISAPIIWLIQYILNGEWAHYEVSLKIDLYIIHQKNYVYNTYIRDLINKMPGLWAMVPYDTFDEAMDFMYPAGYQKNASLDATIKEYHAIQGQVVDTLQAAKNAGVKVSVVSSYGLQPLPVTEYATVEHSDGLVDTRYSSYSATTAFLNNDWVGKGLNRQIVDDGHDHTNYSTNIVTNGFNVDASTCALPENTWFVYGLKRNYWNSESDGMYYFLAWLLSDTSKEGRTVHDSAYYPQFMYFNRFDKPGNLYGYNSSDYKRFYIKGDTNLNGKIEIADARLALRHAVDIDYLTRAALANGDINENGKITISEARKILRVAVNIDADFKDYKDS